MIKNRGCEVEVNEIPQAIRAKQSAARWRRDGKTAAFWEKIEFLVLDALADLYDGEVL